MNGRIGVLLVSILSVPAHVYAGPVAAATPNIEPSRIAYRQDNDFGHTYVLNDSSVFVVRGGGAGKIALATLFFHGAIDKETLANRMLWMLAAANVPAEFYAWAKKSLPANWQLEKDSFLLPLRSERFGTHEFTYSNTGHNQLYILTYRWLAADR